MSHINIGNISMNLEDGWTIATVIFAGPVETNIGNPLLPMNTQQTQFQQNIVVTAEPVPENMTTEKYLGLQRDGLRKAGVDFEVSKPEIVKLDNETDGLLVEQVVMGPSGESVRQMQLICILDKFAFTCIASNLDGDPFDNARARYRNMLLSLQKS